METLVFNVSNQELNVASSQMHEYTLMHDSEPRIDGYRLDQCIRALFLPLEQTVDPIASLTNDRVWLANSIAQPG